MSDYQDLIYDVKDLVATITINRPKVLNAWTQVTLDEIVHALRAAADDSRVAAVVLTGVGERAFCVGGDVNWEAAGGLNPETYKFEVAHALLDCPKPVIARVNGYAIGGGNHLAYFCDLTIAADHAIFGQNGPRVGSPAAGYMVSHSANILGHKRARELWLLCRKYTAHQMMDWGLVNAVVPMAELDAEVRKACDDIIALSPTCLKVIKASLKQQMGNIMTEEMNAFVEKIAPGYHDTGEQKEGSSAFLEKRTPDFSPYR
jgi:2-ketocyclohexanecarboxyl-CoA hydrolase